MDNGQLITWEKNIGQSSLRAKFAELKETDSQELNPVEEPYFAAVINKDGVFSIGSEIHVITYDNEYLIQNGNEEELKNVLNKNIKLGSNLKSFSIQRSVLNQVSVELNNKSTTTENGEIGAVRKTMCTGDRTTIDPNVRLTVEGKG